MKYKIGDKVKVSDRGMKTNSFDGEVIGIEPNTDARVYNVMVIMKDKNDKLTGHSRLINFLENQLTRKIEDV